MVAKSSSTVNKVIEQNILLQKKDVELITSVNKLTKRIDKLLDVFEEASKHVMEAGDERRILDIADKLNGLLDQNKSIAKGLLTLEEYIKTRSDMSSQRTI